MLNIEVILIYTTKVYEKVKVTMTIVPFAQ